MVGLARTYMGPDVQAYLDAKFRAHRTWLRCFPGQLLAVDHEVRVELQFDGLQRKSTLQAYMDEFQKVDMALRSQLLTRGRC